MHHQNHDQDVFHRLLTCGYEVFADEQGYIVRHLRDPHDISCLHFMDELLDFADLMERDKQRRENRKAD